MKNIVIGVDVDGVVANLHTEWFRKYNEDFNDNLTIDKITNWDTHKFVKPECGLNIYEYLLLPDLYDNVEPIDGAKFYTDKLKNDDDVRLVYITTTPIETPGVKFKWLVKHGFLKEDEKDNYIEATDKSVIACNILVDDKYENVLNAFEDGILFAYPHNDGHKYSPRVSSWEEIYDYIHDYILDWKDY